MGEIAKSLGQSAPLEWRSQTYPLSPITFEIQAQFELWLERRALGRLSIHRKALSADEYEEYKQATIRDVNAGTFSWGSEPCQRALSSLPGIKELAFLCLKKAMTTTSPDVSRAIVDQMFEDPEFAERLSIAMRDLNQSPNPKAPVEPGTAA